MITSKNICFIFARGGSQGLVNKNIRPFAGKSLLEYTINFACALEFVDKVFVSTENDDIKKISKSQSVSVIERPEVLASNEVNEIDAWKHAINWVRKNEGDFENFLSLPCTAPLRTKENVYSCFRKISNTKPFIVSVTPAKFNPFFNLVKKDSFDSSITLVNQARYHRRQDAPQIFAITPISYIAKPDEIMQREKIWDGKVFGVEVPASNAVDIDDINDFTYAEYLFKKRLSQN